MTCLLERMVSLTQPDCVTVEERRLTAVQDSRSLRDEILFGTFTNFLHACFRDDGWISDTM